MDWTVCTNSTDHTVIVCAKFISTMFSYCRTMIPRFQAPQAVQLAPPTLLKWSPLPLLARKRPFLCIPVRYRNSSSLLRSCPLHRLWPSAAHLVLILIIVVVVVIIIVVEGTQTTVRPHPLQVRIDQYYVYVQYVSSHVHPNFSLNLSLHFLSSLPHTLVLSYSLFLFYFFSAPIVGQLAQLPGAAVRLFEWVYESSLSQFQPGMLCIPLRFVFRSIHSLNIWKYQIHKLLWIFPILCYSNTPSVLFFPL